MRGMRVLSGGLVVSALAAGTATAYAVHVDQQASSDRATARLLRAAVVENEAQRRQVDADARTAGTKAAQRAAHDAATIRSLTEQVQELSGQVDDLTSSLDSATRPVTVVQAAPAPVRRTKLETLAYCRNLAAQAFPESSSAQDDPTLAHITQAYNDMMQERTANQCLAEQGYPQS